MYLCTHNVTGETGGHDQYSHNNRTMTALCAYNDNTECERSVSKR